ncbi:TetR family transcriptional regulator C-terminal domain-containing protein [Frigidibacter sp. ROC022]|uniref:TetR family transcriptional regulator C-terminal domain-containing protein n=1 Tax=Frigidibacter sp. ROC022 TaxID=2971796 RepID=UPI00215B2418|nr:TetR family transcriptional regulator C-terminal domain-containing protein [Frigidibacter sp. ROC022]MCR8723215.1 TetR family transcriptional regulator C-terminal domain-containing protein [Frigidibacter sp. ROC022]
MRDEDSAEPKKPRQTRIQRKNRQAILEAALDAFAEAGFRGTTLDRIAEKAGLSKPNLLYYFASKEAVHGALLDGLLDLWLAPLRAMDADGEPVEEIVTYALKKLEMARVMPRESRLFAGEILHGAPHMMPEIEGPLRALVDEKAAVIADWMAQGRLAPTDPRHLIFSIWATTQHYADFDVQVRALLQPKRDEHFTQAAQFLETLYRRALTPA